MHFLGEDLLTVDDDDTEPPFKVDEEECWLGALSDLKSNSSSSETSINGVSTKLAAEELWGGDVTTTTLLELLTITSAAWDIGRSWTVATEAWEAGVDRPDSVRGST